MSNYRLALEEKGIALLVTLIALSLFSGFGLYMTLNAITNLRISDNYEARVRAAWAAISGLNHGRALLRGLAFDDLLRGPDGTYSGDPSYRESAKSFAFRNPIPSATARILSVVDPSAYVLGLADDGIVNTGSCDGVAGTVLIPITGMTLDPNSESIRSRYFVKVTDNSGEATELAQDPGDNPFIDGDGIVTVRSIGVARTLTEVGGSYQRSNSVVILESRLKRWSVFDLGPALILEGPRVQASIDGNFEISGGSYAAIGVIDTVPDDTVFPGQMVREAAGSSENITGGNLPPPSILDIGPLVGDPASSKLLDAQYLWDFVHHRVAPISDYVFDGNQIWVEGSAPYAGFYDPTRPANAPEQDPKVVMVRGDLSVMGNVTGGGLLIVTGTLSYSGSFSYRGLIILAGSGALVAAGSGSEIVGSVFMVSLQAEEHEIRFGVPRLSISGDGKIIAHRDVTRMALDLLPPSQIGYREITNQDP